MTCALFAAELEATVASGFPDVLSGNGRCNAPLLVDWLVDTVFSVEDSHAPEVKGCARRIAARPFTAALSLNQPHNACSGI